VTSVSVSRQSQNSPNVDPVSFPETGRANQNFGSRMLGMPSSLVKHSRRDALDLHDGPLPLTPCGPETK
jgi:hypothetical protein